VKRGHRGGGTSEIIEAGGGGGGGIGSHSPVAVQRVPAPQTGLHLLTHAPALHTETASQAGRHCLGAAAVRARNVPK
jgi:hypothetical protein